MSDQRSSKSTRLDPAHDLLVSGEVQEPTPWMALAGRDDTANTQQLDRQTNELLAYVQRQNDEIDSRQAELNARLAQLDNEMRVARLRDGIDAGNDLLAAASVVDAESELPEETIIGAPGPADAGPRVTAPSNSTPMAEFDEVERIVSQFSDDLPLEEASEVLAEVEEDNEPSVMSDPFGPPEPVSESFSLGSSNVHLRSLESGLDINSMAASLDATAVESERRLLAERKNELDRRKAVLQRMQDETQSLHREALEMRLVTEQLWSQLSDQAPAEQLNELLSSLRSRLDEHYGLMNKTLADRKAELTSLRKRMQQKQEDLRQQSQRLQEWVDSRHEQIKNYASQLDAREMLLDRREHRLQEEFSKWEAQRGTYKKQLQGLLKKLNLAGLGD